MTAAASLDRVVSLLIGQIYLVLNLAGQAVNDLGGGDRLGDGPGLTLDLSIHVTEISIQRKKQEFTSI